MCYVACVMSFVRLGECAVSQSPREKSLENAYCQMLVFFAHNLSETTQIGRNWRNKKSISGLCNSTGDKPVTENGREYPKLAPKNFGNLKSKWGIDAGQGFLWGITVRGGEPVHFNAGNSKNKTNIKTYNSAFLYS